MSALVLSLCAFTATVSAGQIGGTAGAYSRIGFGARGMGMGNAMVAVTEGDVFSYYNPALIPWSSFRRGMASFGILSLDRSLNFLGYSMPLPPQAGLSIGVINAGVSDIDGRDDDGIPTGPLRTSENQAYLGFGLRFSKALSLGVNAKFLYYQLYEKVTSTSIGFDIGACFRVSQDLVLGATVRDPGSKYKLDTSDLYGQSGQTTENRFPSLYTVGASYLLPDSIGLVAAEVEFSSAKTMVGRLGVEVPILPALAFRGGLDRIDLKEKGNGIRPSLGFTVRKDFDSWTPAVNYAFVLEPFAPTAMHMITISIIF